jgi:6-phosphogluconolactonase
MTIVYVSNAISGDISVLRMDARSGDLTPVQTAMVGGRVGALAVSPDLKFLYAARRSDPLAVACFSIDASTGELTQIGEAALPESMAYIATDRSGRYLLAASYAGSQLTVSPIAGNGVVQAVQQVLPTQPKAHAIGTDPSNTFVFATSLGGDIVMQMRFDAATGRLSPNTPAEVSVRPKAGPRHFAFHPSLKFFYLLNELDATIDVFDHDAQRGTLSAVQTVATMPPGAAGEPWAADLHLTPDGRFLYSSERRSSTLAAFSIDLARGHLQLIGHVPTETQPRAFNISPDGRFVLAVGQLSHRLSSYAIDTHSGALNKLKDYAVGQDPNWVEIVDLATRKA